MKNKSKLGLSLRKVLLSTCVAAPLAVLPAPLWALPSTAGGNVSSNSVATTYDSTTAPGTLFITDTSVNRLVLKWGVFGSTPNLDAAGTINGAINSNETVRWNLASSSAAVLNMVSTGSTTVAGTLSSNGAVVILNPNGITLAGTAIVNTTGLSLSTLPEAEFNFLSTGVLSNSGTPLAAGSAAMTIAPGASISVGTSGNVYLAGNVVNVAGTIRAAELNITARPATSPAPSAAAVNLGSGGALTVGAALVVGPPAVDAYGNLVINSNGGAVNLAAGSPVTLNGNVATINTGGGALTGPSAFRMGTTTNDNALLTINTATGIVDLDNVGANNQGGSDPQNRRLNLAVTAGATDIISQSNGELRLNASTISGPLTLSNNGSIGSGGDSTVSGAISLSATSGAAGGVSFSGNGDLNFTTLAVNGTGNRTLVSKTGSVSLPGLTGGKDITVTAATNIVQTGSLVTAQSDGTQRFEATSGSITLNNAANNFFRLILRGAPGGATVTDGVGGLTLANGNSVTGDTFLTSAGTATFGRESGDTLTFNGNLSLTAATAIDQVNNNLSILGTVNLNTAGNITLDGASGNGVGLNNRFGQFNAASTGNGLITALESTTLNLGNILSTTGGLRAYSATGDVIQSGTIVVGTLLVGAGTAFAPGNVSLTNASNQILGVPNISDPAAAFRTPGLRLLDDITLLSGFTSNNLDPIGTYLVRDLTIVSNASVVLAPISSASNTGIAGNLSITASGVGSDITLGFIPGTPAVVGPPAVAQVNASTGPTRVGGTVTLVAGNNISATNDNNNFGGGAVTVTAGGDVSVRASNTYTANATLTQNAAGKTATFRSGGTQRIGTVTSNYTGLTTFRSDNDGSDTVADTVTGIQLFGPVSFQSSGGINVARAGHSFGAVSVSTGNNRSATVTESGTMRLMDVNVGGTGSLTLTSFAGDILQDNSTAQAGIRLGNGNSNSNFTFNAAGRIELGDTNSKNDFNGGKINSTAGGDVTIVAKRRSTVLGNINAGGKLTVDLSQSGTVYGGSTITAGTGYTNGLRDQPLLGIPAPTLPGGVQAVAVYDTNTAGGISAIRFLNSGQGYAADSISIAIPGGTGSVVLNLTGNGNENVTQAANTRLNVFDTVTVRNRGAGNITLGNTGNRLGGVVLNSVSGNIIVTESTTLNLKSVSTTGTLAAASELGNIQDSTDALVANNSIGSATVQLGAATFTANNGNISLGLAGNNLGTVGFTTGGNVSLLDGVSNLQLSASTIGGTFDIISTVASGILSQSGAVVVAGNTTFTTNNGNIDLSNAANQFGAVRFTANSVVLAEATTLNLRSGSVATGPVQFSTGGDFVTSGAGGSSFTNNLTINAPSGRITPGPGSLLVVGNLTVFSNVLKDLHNLSKTGNLTNKDPIYLGSGPDGSTNPDLRPSP